MNLETTKSLTPSHLILVKDMAHTIFSHPVHFDVKIQLGS